MLYTGSYGLCNSLHWKLTLGKFCFCFIKEQHIVSSHTDADFPHSEKFWESLNPVSSPFTGLCGSLSPPVSHFSSFFFSRHLSATQLLTECETGLQSKFWIPKYFTIDEHENQSSSLIMFITRREHKLHAPAYDILPPTTAGYTRLLWNPSANWQFLHWVQVELCKHTDRQLYQAVLLLSLSLIHISEPTRRA